MITQSPKWKHALKAFLDVRALVMFFLGFSAGIPILLIFSSLSLWLGEAGIEKSAVTFFSWAALGYSFKFIWAPLIDELPVAYLTKRLGRRRSWLLIAQVMIIGAIAIMAFSDPALGQASLIQMAVGAVLLGFSAATQDIVIDAYRIEIAEPQTQTVLASTYNAGYRIGMIVAGAGALLLAAKFGTSKGNYIYSAWQYTYLIMAGFMLVGIATTLAIKEPQVERIARHYKRQDYLRLVAVFALAVVSFVLSYIYSNGMIEVCIQFFNVKDNFLLFCFEAFRFLCAVGIAVLVATGLVKLNLVNKEMAMQTWVSPVQDFFGRYGLKLALLLLLLIGFYRISDIMSGVISNNFYQDLNFTKEEIAKAVKIYGVFFSLLGGFVGGFLAQRFNITRLMFVGAVLASATNLIFIGLVNSGKTLDPVYVKVGSYETKVVANAVGEWSTDIPTAHFKHENEVSVHTHYKDEPSDATSVKLPILTDQSSQKIQLFPLNLYADQQNKVVIKGQVDSDFQSRVEIALGTQKIIAKVDQYGFFTAFIESQTLKTAQEKKLTATLYNQNNVVVSSTTLPYEVTPFNHHLDMDIKPLQVIKTENENTHIHLEGKVIKSYSSNWLYFAIIVDNLASGLAGAAFIAFLSSLTSVSFTAVQYAIFSSLMTLTPKILGGYSGTIVTHIGYAEFFLMTTLMGIPVLVLIVIVGRLLNQHQKEK